MFDMAKRAVMPKPQNLSEAGTPDQIYQRAEEEWRRGDPRRAFGNCLQAAKRGFSSAFRVLGQFYDQGFGVKVNENAALYWYRRAWRSERDSSAANNIGCMLRDRGRTDLALMWLRRAAQKGDGDANLQIAKIFMHRKRGLWKAMYYLKETCDAKFVTKGSKEEARALLRKLKGKSQKRVGADITL